MDNKLITVFTPSYNRAYRLGDLYKSLVNQTSKNFYWYIIDDGSSDNTKEIVESMISENSITIRYEWQKNAGKHAAHNKAAEHCGTELFLCVDSDDYLTEDAIEVLEKTWNSIPEEHKTTLSGIVASRGDKEGNVIGTEFPSDIEEAPLNELYAKGKKGDTALAFRTKVLLQFPFPIFEGERFLREHVVYDEIDKQYNLKVLNQIIYIGEYLDDGLSWNASTIELKSPRGAALGRLCEARKCKSFSSRMRKLSAYVLFKWIAHDLTSAFSEIGFFQTVVLIPFAGFGYLRYKIKEFLQ